MLQPSTERSLADWEDEGGTSRSPVLAEYTMCLPSLPRGYSSQVASGFNGSAERSYRFNRVYGAPGAGADQASARLDEDRSYWSVTWSVHLESGEEAPASRWMSYAQTRTLGGPPISFARFSSMVEMRDEIPTLLDSVGISRRRNEIIT